MLTSFTQCPCFTCLYLASVLGTLPNWSFNILLLFLSTYPILHSLISCSDDPSSYTHASQLRWELFLTTKAKQIERNLDIRIAVWNHVALYYLEITHRTDLQHSVSFQQLSRIIIRSPQDGGWGELVLFLPPSATGYSRWKLNKMAVVAQCWPTLKLLLWNPVA